MFFFNICCDYGRVFRRIYRCSLLTVSTYFVAWFDYLLYVMLRLAIVFLSITLYVCSGDGHSAKQKATQFLPFESITSYCDFIPFV